MLSYLGKDYDNLITHDIICHGVPSPELWDRYVRWRKWDKNAKNIAFREKSDGWESSSKFVVEEPRKYVRKYSEDIFSSFFFNNYSLRPICFDCPFKTGNKKSDITLADLWGIREILKDCKDDRGMSLVIVNTNKGKELFQSIKNGNFCKQISYDQALVHNLMFFKSVSENKDKRENFFADCRTMSFPKLHKKYGKRDPLVLRVKKLLYPIKQKIRNIKF